MQKESLFSRFKNNAVCGHDNDQVFLANQKCDVDLNLTIALSNPINSTMPENVKCLTFSQSLNIVPTPTS